MDKRTRVSAIASLAKSAAEIAADIAALTSDAAGYAGTPDLQNFIVGGLLPCEQRVEALQAILRAVQALHTTEAV